jgi:hypothetical protein
MRNTKFKFFMLLGAFVPGIATSVFAQDTTYVWQSADGDPLNIQAAIVLDSPSSVNGSASDVVSLYISDTVDTYSWNPENTSLWLSPFSPFTWNSAQILDMDIVPQGGPQSVLAQFAELPDGNGEIFDFSTSPISPCDQSGEWVAASTVPEPSALQLLSLAVPILIAVRRFAAPAARQRTCR